MFRIIAHIFSIIFHPLLMLTYMLILLLIINPFLFGVNSIMEKIPLILIIFFSTFLIPGLSVVMMKLLGFVNSIELKTQKERIIPFIITSIFYLWLFLNFKNNPDIPKAYSVFIFGATIGLFVAFFINNFYKISIHGVGMGGLLGMVIITMFFFSYGSFTIDTMFFGAMQISMNTLLIGVILLTGIVGTSRLILKAHTPDELYLGIFAGLLSQVIAINFF